MFLSGSKSFHTANVLMIRDAWKYRLLYAILGEDVTKIPVYVNGILDALRELNPIDRNILQFYYRSGNTCSDIAERFKMSADEVACRIQNILDKLKSPEISQHYMCASLVTHPNTTNERSTYTPIRELGLRTRTYNALTRANIIYIEQLTNMDMDDVLHCKNIGKLALDDIIDKLQVKNLSLRPVKMRW